MQDKPIKNLFKSLLANLKAVGQDFLYLGKSLKKQSDTPNEKTKPDEKSDGKPISVVASLSTPIAIRVDAETHERENAWKRIKTGFEIIGIVAVVIYAVVTYQMWREMINATDVNARTVNEARLTRLQADKSLNAAIEQFRLDQRAWISVSQDDISLTDGKPIVIPFRLVNTGKTAAFNIQGNIAVNILRQGEEPEFIYSKNTGHPHSGFRAGIIFPGSKLSPNIPFIEVGPKSPTIPLLTPEVHQKINKGELSIIAHGRLTYSDVFNREHWVTFCSDTAGRSSKCIEHNNADR